MAGEVLVKVEGVSKKFCKDLKTSLWYGVKDLFSGLRGNQEDGVLRPKEFWAVKDINFELRRGECLGLIGHNGAGKSTLLKILNGLINPDAGTVTMRGRVGALIELGAGFNPILTGRENIYNNGAVLGFTRKEIDAKVEAIIDFSEIREFIDMPVQNYSSGMKVRLGFAVAAQMEPDVLIIDEVLAVGDVGFRYKCLNAIGEIMKNSAVIFVTHSMPQIYRICTEIMLMNKGMVIEYGNNLGKGIDKYFEMSNDGKPQIAGTGEASLVDCELSNSNNIAKSNEILNIEYGSGLNIKLKIKLANDINKARVKLILWNQDLIPVMDILDTELNSYLVKNNSLGLIEINVLIPKLTVNNGKHYFSVLIDSEDLSKHYCRYDKAGMINVSIARPNGALLLTQAQWKS
jgi:lipopolysaccharide transport system ATP-binding protein